MDVNKLIRKHFRVKRITAPPILGYAKTTRHDIYAVFKEAGYTYGAEIGVYRGINAKAMLCSVPNLKLILIDPWKKFSRKTSDNGMERNFERTKRRVRHWNPQFIRKPSLEAVKEFKDESLDFIYIDGLHDFDSVIADLIYWVPKVRKGGIVAGHDFFLSYDVDVIRAVHAYTEAHNINNWYITGGLTSYVDSVEPPSYFWVK